MTNPIIETFDLTKNYYLKGKNTEIQALNGVNLSINEGEIFGLLGPNGAGKTTMIYILTTIKQPTSGYAVIDGYNILKNPNKAKERIALMLEAKMIYYRITGYDNLKFFCQIYKVPHDKERIYNMAKEFGLDSWLNQYVERYSSGMIMKLALCRTLLLNRKILILDEPTLGLDVRSVSSIIKKLKDLKTTIFLTSHDMNVVEKLCDRIGFINKGRIVKIGTKDDIKKFEHSEVKFELMINDKKNELKSELKLQEYISEIIDTNNGFVITLKNRKFFNELLLILGKYQILTLKEVELSLEDLFLKFT